MAVPGDYDGDMVSDMAIFDEATALWSIWSISKGLILDGFAWGWPGCRVVGACGNQQSVTRNQWSVVSGGKKEIFPAEAQRRRE